MSSYTVPLGPVAAGLEADSPALLAALGEFVTLAPARSDDAPLWTVLARHRVPDAEMTVSAWGVGHRTEPAARRVVLAAPQLEDLVVATRKALREPLVAACEQRGAVMLHAAAVAVGEQVVLLVGDAGSGKTTLALDGLVHHGAAVLSNDHCLLSAQAHGLAITALPTVLPVKTGTYLALGEQLPPPWDRVDLSRAEEQRLRDASLLQQRTHPGRVLYTYRRLGQPPVPHRVLRPGAVTVALVHFADQPQRPQQLGPLARAELARHVRGEWWADPDSNTHYYPRPAAASTQAGRGSDDILRQLTAMAPVLSWAHAGQLAPLINWLNWEM